MSPNRARGEKHCVVCGRRMTWRRKWADDWERVRYCSGRCRSRGLGPMDGILEETMVRLLERRAGSASLCPSEVAEAVEPHGWEPLMEQAREAARRLAARDVVVLKQGGRAVDPSTARGVVRVARGPGWGARRSPVEA